MPHLKWIISHDFVWLKILFFTLTTKKICKNTILHTIIIKLRFTTKKKKKTFYLRLIIHNILNGQKTLNGFKRIKQKRKKIVVHSSVIPSVDVTQSHYYSIFI